MFRRVARDGALGRHGLAAESVRLILKRRAWDAGHRDAGFASIMPRGLWAGCITTLAHASMRERDIMKHSRHGNQAVMRGYIRAAGDEEAFTSAVVWRQRERKPWPAHERVASTRSQGANRSKRLT